MIKTIVEMVNLRSRTPPPWPLGKERPESTRQNPLRLIALVSALSIAKDLYQMINHHYIDWIAVADSLLCVAFLIFYIRQRQFAWLISLLIFGVLMPVDLIILYLQSPARFPSAIVIWGTIAFWICCVVYIVCMRMRYYSYLASIKNNQT
jgi:hypothetical protein